MGGGAHYAINLSKISGLGLPAIEYEEKSYAGQSGITTIGRRDLPRTITLSGDVNGGQWELMKFLKTFYYPGYLICESGSIKRQIKCKCINMDDITRRNSSNINGFVVQLKADDPYFYDIHKTTLPLAVHENVVTTKFTLPCAFTKRIHEGNCNNTGDIICYPVIDIYARHEPTEGIENVISLQNSATGSKLIINHTMVLGEVLTIDVPSREIISNINGDVTNQLETGVELGDFFLQVGSNDITYETSDKLQPLSIQVTYNNRYIMAVM